MQEGEIAILMALFTLVAMWFWVYGVLNMICRRLEMVAIRGSENEQGVCEQEAAKFNI